MSQNTSCNECQNVIKKEGDFIHQDDKTLYGYPRYSQINADGTQTTFHMIVMKMNMIVFKL